MEFKLVSFESYYVSIFSYKFILRPKQDMEHLFMED